MNQTLISNDLFRVKSIRFHRKIHFIVCLTTFRLCLSMLMTTPSYYLHLRYSHLFWTLAFIIFAINSESIGKIQWRNNKKNTHNRNKTLKIVFIIRRVCCCSCCCCFFYLLHFSANALAHLWYSTTHAFRMRARDRKKTEVFFLSFLNEWMKY